MSLTICSERGWKGVQKVQKGQREEASKDIKEIDNKLLTNGGRVLSVVSNGSDFKQALSKSYEIAEKIDFKDKNYRKDIGFDL